MFFEQTMSRTAQDPPEGHQVPSNLSKEETRRARIQYCSAPWQQTSHGAFESISPFTRMFFVPQPCPATVLVIAL